jgi:uncharacterized integral membrane protein (TIGR00698 family)
MSMVTVTALKPVSAAPENSWRTVGRLLPGCALTAALAAVAAELSKISALQSNGISVLTLAIVLGIVVANAAYPRIERFAEGGVSFSKHKLLRLGIILFGLRLTFHDVAGVGIAGIATDAIVLASTFALSCWAGTRLFGLDRTTAMLIGAGSSICGAAAIMAAEPVVRGRADQVTVAVSTVVVFGTLAIFLYPALYHLNMRHHLVAISPLTYGMIAGSTIHEVAQVVAAGRAISEAAANTAVIAKMVRVMMLAPFLIVLSAYLARAGKDAGGARPSMADFARRIVVPWFAVGFLAVTALNTLDLLPRMLVDLLVRLDTFALAMAMAALGLNTRFSALRTAGAKPLALAALLFVWLMVGGTSINLVAARLFAA